MRTDHLRTESPKLHRTYGFLLLTPTSLTLIGSQSGDYVPLPRLDYRGISKQKCNPYRYDEYQKYQETHLQFPSKVSAKY